MDGSDDNTGNTESDPIKTQGAIPKGCRVVRFKRGSVFNEALSTGGFTGGGAKVYTNYGDPADPLPKFEIEPVPSNGSIVSAYQGVPWTVCTWPAPAGTAPGGILAPASA